MTPPPFPESTAVAGSGIAVDTDMAEVSRGLVSVLTDISRLVRPRIAVMVLVTVSAAAWITAGGDRLPVAAFAGLLVGTALVASSSSIANQILERDTDRLMPRTANRPIVAGRLSVAAAWWLAAASLVIGLAVMVRACGWQPAVAAVATWLVYVVIYTPMKRWSPLNTAVGAIAGALPVVIGWAAAAGPARLAAGDGAAALAVGALGTVLSLWQFPHFMAAALCGGRPANAHGRRSDRSAGRRAVIGRGPGHDPCQPRVGGSVGQRSAFPGGSRGGHRLCCVYGSVCDPSRRHHRP
jgi:heme o synthase